MTKRYKTILDPPTHQLPDLHTLMAMLGYFAETRPFISRLVAKTIADPG